jgi:hypothetical protein
MIDAVRNVKHPSRQPWLPVVSPGDLRCRGHPSGLASLSCGQGRQPTGPGGNSHQCHCQRHHRLHQLVPGGGWSGRGSVGYLVSTNRSCARVNYEGGTRQRNCRDMPT